MFILLRFYFLSKNQVRDRSRKRKIRPLRNSREESEYSRSICFYDWETFVTFLINKNDFALRSFPNFLYLDVRIIRINWNWKEIKGGFTAKWGIHF